jgi:hypothetical protein
MTLWLSALLPVSTVAADGMAVDVGSDLQPFIDRYLIDRAEGVTLKLHSPERREVALRFDAPWEGSTSAYVSVFQDGHRFRMYYRGSGTEPDSHEVTCYAESLDGIHWVKPELGLIAFEGSRRNNIILTGEGTHCFAVFKDANPAASDDERYKAVSVGSCNDRPALIAFVSSDGLRWHRLRDEPIITQGKFDSQNLAFWDTARSEYAAYVRDFRDGVRGILRSTSPDFRTWSDPVWLNYGDAPIEHLYTNAVSPMPEAPSILIGMPMRFRPDRRFHADHPHMGASDGVFMSSQDGLHWYRFRSAFIRPGPDPGNWTDRSNMPAWGVLVTGKNEWSVYWSEHYRTEGPHLRRGTVRPGGFVSAHAPPEGGELATPPLHFKGNRLIINYATSAAGGIRVEVQDEQGTPINGYTLSDAVEIFGDESSRAVSWTGGGDLTSLAGRAIRLRFVMSDADLYALRFQPQ